MIEDHQLRDCQAFKDDNLQLSTTSNEAAKIFDLAVHQYVGWYEDKKVGGMAGALKTLNQLDPDFVLGKAFAFGTDLMGTGQTLKDPAFASRLQSLEEDAAKATNLPKRELMHVRAMKEWASGHMIQATRTWEDILLDHPKDVLALKLAHDTYFYLGKTQLIRDSVARVLPEYKPSSTYYGYLKGMYAFGLEETNFYRQAEQNAKEALDLNKHDAWASHALTHVYEMEGRQGDGEKFLQGTKDDWTICGYLACHMYWHWCLILIEEGRYEDVLQLYDTIMHQRVLASKTMLDFVDTTSLLYRLQLEGVDVGDRWEDIYEICRPHLNDHVSAFNDIHLLLSLCGIKKSDVVREHSKSLHDYVDTAQGDNVDICRNLGVDVYEAVAAYSNGEYEKTIELLLPLRQELISVGGSHAQRDIFSQVLIHAALKSPNRDSWKLARSLLNERKALKPNSPLTDRLLSRLLTAHAVAEEHS